MTYDFHIIRSLGQVLFARPSPSSPFFTTSSKIYAKQSSKVLFFT